MRIDAYNLETRAPDDLHQLRQLLDAGVIRAGEVIAVIGKTEGNGGRNDFTRALAMSALEHLFAPRLGLDPERVQDRIIFSFSGGTEGVVTPHMIVFTRTDEPAPRAARFIASSSEAPRHRRRPHPRLSPRRDRPPPPDPRDRRARPPARQRPRSGRSPRRPPRPDEGRDPALHR